MNLIVCSFNNYYNRIYKKYDTISGYVLNSRSYIALDNIDFNPADGVTTTLILGKGTGMFLNWEKSAPDYLVTYVGEQGVSDPTIDTRWFIMDMDRLRGGQYKLTLKRDLIADFMTSLSDQPVYVEKGYISDVNSPLLCNNEGLVVNQIKKDEKLLKDISQCPWLVMYLKKGVLGSTSVGQQGQVVIDVPENDGSVYETLSTPIGQWSMYQYTTQDYNVWETLKFLVFWTQTNTINDYQYTCDKESSSTKYITGTHYTSNLRYNANTGNAFRELLDTQFKSHYNNMVTAFNNDKHFGTYNDIWKYNGKIIKDSDGKYYQVSVYTRGSMPIPTAFLDTENFPSLKTLMNNYWNAATSQSVSANDEAFGLHGKYLAYRITLSEVSSVETTIDFSTYQGNGTVDSPLYDIICMPYGEVYFSNPGELLYGLTTSKERSIRVMNSLAKSLSSSYVLDLQLLPYCPCQELLFESNYTPTIFNLDMVHQGVYGRKTGVGITDAILVAPKATFEFNINESITIDDSSEVNGCYKTKYLNDCTMLRLCSPNYNGLFEMNIAKNGGSIDYFNVDVTMRPYNPYIHVNPNFKFLYERDWDDARGLICGGDFSLGIINEAWTQYEIQNKNYQAIFDRQIQNMDVNNSIARTEAGWQAAAGTVQGAASGAMAGFMMGGGYGAAAGAIIGAGTSLGAGIADYANLERRQRENRSFAIDNFNLQLGNIRALPNSITKTSALTANNKLFPFVEIYECTDVEKVAYYNKLKYDGMTVGIIDNISNYIGYNEMFKGQLIRNVNVMEDNHVLEELNKELMKGAYI